MPTDGPERHTPILWVDAGALVPRLLNQFDDAMRAVGVPSPQRKAALNVWLFGHPDPDTPPPAPALVRCPPRAPLQGIPCGVCAETVTHWVPLRGERYQALPCRHTTDQIAERWLAALNKRLPQVTV